MLKDWDFVNLISAHNGGCYGTAKETAQALLHDSESMLRALSKRNEAGEGHVPMRIWTREDCDSLYRVLDTEGNGMISRKELATRLHEHIVTTEQQQQPEAAAVGESLAMAAKIVYDLAPPTPCTAFDLPNIEQEEVMVSMDDFFTELSHHDEISANMGWSNTEEMCECG